MTDVRRVRRLVRRANRECASGRGRTRRQADLVEAFLSAGDVDGFAEVIRAEAGPRVVDFICAEALDRLVGSYPRRPDPTLSGFCLMYGFLPADAGRRVLFLHAAGRSDDAHALDPDAGLLSAGYAGAGEGVRTLVRNSVIGGTDPVAIRALVTTSRSARVGELGHHEVHNLAAELHRGESYQQLWDLLRDAAVVHANWAKEIPTTWQPADAADRPLLAKARAARLNGSLNYRGDGAARMVEPSPLRGPKRLGGVPVAASFSPNGSSMALAVRTSSPVAEGLIVDRPLRGDRYDAWRFDGNIASVVHLGKVVVAADATGIVRHAFRAVGTHLYEGHVRPESLSRVAGGYAVAASRGGLVLGSVDGHVRQVSTDELGLDGPAWDVVTDTDGVRIAVSSVTRLVVLDAEGNVLARHAGRACQPVAFDGPGHLITRSEKEIRRWRIEDGALVAEAATGAPSVARIKGRALLLPVHRRLVAIRMRERVPAYYDADTLEETGGPLSSTGYEEPTGLAASPRGRYVAVLRKEVAELHDTVEMHDTAQEAVVDLLNTPMCAMGPADAERAAFYGRLEPDPNVAGYLDVLHAFLTRRFRGEIALRGTGAPASGTRTDIAVSDDEEG